jgi:hypothetical protein
MYLASLLANTTGLLTSQFLSFVQPQLATPGVTFALGFLQQGSDYGVSERHITLEGQAIIPDPGQLEGWNVWFTPAQFSGGKRNQANVYAAQSLWTDLDVDPTGTKPGTYVSLEAAWNALWAFAAQHNLPPNAVVDSGRGLQAYWVLSRPLPSAEWQALAMRLALVMRQSGLRYDPSRATDISSWMRLPGVQNPKPGARVASVLYVGQHPRWTPEHLLQMWGHLDVSHLLAEMVSKNNGPTVQIPPGAWDTIPSNIDVRDLQLSWEDFCTNANGAHCPRIAWAIQPQNQAYISEPEWYALMGFFRAFEDGRRLAHWASCYHPNYSPEATDKKFYQWQGFAPSKATFQAKLTNIPGAPSCDTCVNAHACKSPAQWGKRVPKVIPIHQEPAQAAPQIQVTVTAPQPMDESPAMMSAEFDYGHAGEAWGMWTSISRETATGDKETRIHLCKQRIYPRRIVKVKLPDSRGNQSQVTCLHVDVVSSDSVARPMYIPLADLDSQHKTATISALHDAGCTNPGHGWNNAGPIEWKGFMTRLLHQARTMAMSASGLPDVAHSHLGWADDQDGNLQTEKFVLGPFAYGKAGAVERAVVDSPVATFAKGVPSPMTDTTYPGGVAGLSRDFNALLQASLPAGDAKLPDQFALAASLATCLQALCVPEIERGGLLVFHNDGSGTGKTSLLRRAMSIWTKSPGDWIQQDATMQGFVEKRLQVAHSLPVVWDDMIRSMSRDDSHRFAEFVLRTTGRQQRVRQTSANVGAWTTFAFASMNPHPHALITSDNREAANALNRVLAVSVPPGRLTAATRPAQGQYDAWAGAYGGLVGQVFLRSVISDDGRAHARNRYEAWRDYIRHALRTEDANERFNRSIIASVLTAAELASQLGLLQLDMQAMVNYAMGLLTTVRASVDTATTKATDLAAELMTFVGGAVADIQVSSAGVSTVINRTPGVLRLNRVRELATGAHVAIIPARVIDEWAKTQGIASAAVKQSLVETQRAQHGQATFYTGTGSTKVTALIIPIPDLTNPLEDVCLNPASQSQNTATFDWAPSRLPSQSVSPPPPAQTSPSGMAWFTPPATSSGVRPGTQT